MAQYTFTDIEYAHRRRGARLEQFLGTMEKLLPWNKWAEQIRPLYPEGKRGRPPIGIDTMLRMMLLQDWFDLSAEAVEDIVYDSYAMRQFLHVDFLERQVPSATSLLRFRRLLRKAGLESAIRDEVDILLATEGLLLQRGVMADPKLIKKQ